MWKSTYQSFSFIVCVFLTQIITVHCVRKGVSFRACLKIVQNSFGLLFNDSVTMSTYFKCFLSMADFMPFMATMGTVFLHEGVVSFSTETWHYFLRILLAKNMKDWWGIVYVFDIFLGHIAQPRWWKSLPVQAILTDVIVFKTTVGSAHP